MVTKSKSEFMHWVYMYFLQGVAYFVVACVIIFQIVRHRNATGRAVDSEEITSYVITNDLISNIVEWLLKFRHSKFSALYVQSMYTCSFACGLHITAIGDQNCSTSRSGQTRCYVPAHQRRLRVRWRRQCPGLPSETASSRTARSRSQASDDCVWWWRAPAALCVEPDHHYPWHTRSAERAARLLECHNNRSLATSLS